ncbi:glycoside hydrolase family 39 [Candidatus Kirkpatrickella diaphorinae]|uniref:Glycoside hydrolase family 39 n=1 Tax=Candidatus Kirkpatrickella diaphorinae TaxID=2984322 RepID=A0ABY6GHM8_9PROT|nr:glycoside hydrolase family 39 [Candidatus Kirkpatrickella diaphorinae]UYH50759.1 glycoside hydrolase family 39 [Candidatus Kirkpatrickella diaphorinae]
MQQISINANQPAFGQGKNGQVKDINGVNGAPISFMPGYPDLQDQFNQLGISHVRFHDIFGPGDIEDVVFPLQITSQLMIAVPIPEKIRAAAFVAAITKDRAIFPHANAGMRVASRSLASSSPNWAPTDYYIRKTMENIESLNPGHIERNVMFRVGRSNGGDSSVPANFDIYADLVGQAAQRYSADISLSGIPRKVAYWEIWNEPDLVLFWMGTPKKFYSMYEKIARKIKSIDPSAKVGGSGVANGDDGSGPYTRGLVDYCRTNDVPLDFLSWHYYAQNSSDPRRFATCAALQRQNLDRAGFTSAESICTEWNITPLSSAITASAVQSAENAAYITASFITMNKSAVDKAYYYRGDAGFLGLFNDAPNPRDPSSKAFCTYAAQAFGLYKQMFGTPQLLATPELSGNDIYVLAGRGTNAVNVLVSNFTPDLRLAAGAKTPSGGLNQQHYVDSGRLLFAIDDDWSIEHWFGGSKPSILRQTHYEPPSTAAHPDAPETEEDGEDPGASHPAPVSAPAPAVMAVNDGIVLNVSGLPTSTPRLEVRRIVQGGDLGAVLPPVNNGGVNVQYNGNNITIYDPLAVQYTVTHYSIIW